MNDDDIVEICRWCGLYVNPGGENPSAYKLDIQDLSGREVYSAEIEAPSGALETNIRLIAHDWLHRSDRTDDPEEAYIDSVFEAVMDELNHGIGRQRVCGLTKGRVKPTP